MTAAYTWRIRVAVPISVGGCPPEGGLMRFKIGLLLAVMSVALLGVSSEALAATVDIDYGAQYLRGPHAWVGFSADPGDRYYRISNTSDFSGVAWHEIGYATTIDDWVLASGEGVHTVYMQFSRTPDGASPTTAQDSVVVDLYSPTCKLITRTVYAGRFNRVYFSTYDSATKVIGEIMVRDLLIWANTYSDKAVANGTHSFRWYCGLRRGKYTVKTFAHDRGCNEQPWRSFTLRVK
jgi:hypothetical protein